MAGPGVPPGRLEGLQLQDVTTTLLDRFDLPTPPEMMGKVVHPVSAQPRRRVFRSGARPSTEVQAPADAEKQIYERLKALGYVE